MFFQLLLQRIKLLPKFLFLVLRDVFYYYKNHLNLQFDYWGLHIYCGKFGAGKTCSMIRDAYYICNKYKGMTVITNLKLIGFPEDTDIRPLNSIQDILNAPDGTIVVVDEIGTIFNSRDFANGNTKKGSKEGGLPKILFQHICQCRHRRIMIMGTVQRWGFLDKQLRDITADVTICSTFFPHPFSRMVTNYKYDAYEYDQFYQSPIKPLSPLYAEVWLQTDFYRNLYDTKEMVNTLLTMEYISDEEIARNRAFEAIGLAPDMAQKPKRTNKQQKIEN